MTDDADSRTPTPDREPPTTDPGTTDTGAPASGAGEAGTPGTGPPGGEHRSNLRDQPSDERRMLPWVLVALVVVALATWGVVEWTGWGEPRQEEAWKPEAPPPAAGSAADALPPAPAPALAYQQFHEVCQTDAPTEAEQAAVYAATCLDHALETLRAAAGTREGLGESLAPALDEAETAVRRLQRASGPRAGDLPVERLAVEAAGAVVALARETAAATSVDPELVARTAAAAEALDPEVALAEQTGALAELFSRLGETLLPLAQPSPPPAPVPP